MSSLCCDAVHELSSVCRLCISASFVRVCTVVSYVAGGVELTVHKESVVEEMKEVELRSCCAQFN